MMGKTSFAVLAFCLFGMIATCVVAQDFNIPNIDMEQLKNIKLPEGADLEGLPGHQGHDHDSEEGEAPPAPRVPRARAAPSGVNYVPPKPSGSVVFFEPFDDSWTSRWTVIQSDRYNGMWNVEEARHFSGIPGDKGLVVTEAARHYAVIAPFDKPLDPTGKDLVIQYEVRLQDGLDCGGAYLKLPSSSTSFKPKDFNNDTPYVIMFGPDKCGSTNKVHFIFRHQNPLTKQWEEKHLRNPPAVPLDKLTHLYTLHVKPDNSFEIFIDQESSVKGNLLEDFTPSVNPPKTIDDPTDKKPSDWVDQAEIVDTTATKPDDWDEDQPAAIPDPDAVKPDDWLDEEPEQIPDPNAVKPDDWSDDEDGNWEAPTIENPKCAGASGCGRWTRPSMPNPLYKGKWTQPLIPNPAYKGPWSPRQIPNPNYFEDKHPANFHPIAGVGIEIWTMTDGIMFDNILITTEKAVADAYADDTFAVKRPEEKKLQKEDDAAAAGDDSLLGRAQALVNQALEALQNPVVAGTVGVAVLIPLVVCFLLPGKKAAASLPPAGTAPAQPAAATETTRDAPAVDAPKATASPKQSNKKQ